MFGRKKKKNNNDYAEPDLPITPMLDMSFQLLAFFVTTYNPGPVEAMLPMSLPKLDGGPSSVLTLPTDDETEDVTVQVESTENGAIDNIAVFTKATAGAPQQIGKDPNDLRKFLDSKFKALKGKPAGKVTIEMGDDLNYQNVVRVIDETRKAGFDRVSPSLLNKAKK
jgi:biopolymer transport protein ExbD